MYQKNKILVKEFVYDFSVNGGATGAISLVSNEPNGNLLPEGFIFNQVSLYTETALASTGSATVTVGNTLDPDGFFVDIFAAASAAGSALHAGQLDGALIWDTSLDAIKACRVTSASNTQDVSITIGTAPLSAGKIRVVIEGHMPSSIAGHETL